MEFWKMNGAGNDFIVVDDRRNAIPENRWPEIVRVLCERHMSIGADGFMVVKPPTCGGDYKMLFFNSDGSTGEMCGNGARCICRYGFESGLAGETQRVETTAGMVTGWRADRQLYRIRLNDPCHLRLNGTAEVDGITYDCAYVELGDPGIPHAAGQLRLDGHVDVLAFHHVERERAGGDVGQNALEPFCNGFGIGGRDDALGGQHVSMGDRAGDVLDVESLIHGQRRPEALGKGIGAFGESSRPQCHSVSSVNR